MNQRSPLQKGVWLPKWGNIINNQAVKSNLQNKNKDGVEALSRTAKSPSPTGKEVWSSKINTTKLKEGRREGETMKEG